MSRELECQLAGEMDLQRDDLADRVTQEFVRDHPRWMARFGPDGPHHTRQDHRFHLEFLSSALRYGRPEAFAEYVRWCVRLLVPRRVSTAVLSNTLRRLEAELQKAVGPERGALLRPYFQAGLEAAGEPPSQTPAPTRNSLYLQALLAGDREVALRICLEDLQRGTPALEVYRRVGEAQEEMGRLWETGRITVAEEHLGTAISQYVLTRLSAYQEIPRPHRGRAVITGAEGESHQVGGQMVADALAADGWDVEFLGAGTPHVDVVRRVRDERVSLLAISVMLMSTVPSVEDLIRRVREACGPDQPKIMVGGGAFRWDPELWKQLGADGWAQDLEGAVQVARDLAPPGESPSEPVLLVDDESVIRRVTGRMLGVGGWAVVEAASGEEALALCRGLPLKAAVLDVVMAGMNGLEVARRLRQDQPHLPLLFMSGFEPPEDLPEGAVFLTKPFTFAALREGLRQAMEPRAPQPAAS